MILYCKSMSFILHSCNQSESFRILCYRNFLIIVIQSSCSMVIVLYHSTNRNMKIKAVQNFKSYVYLTFSTIHHKNIREVTETSKFVVFFFHIKLFTFFYSVTESSCKNFSHAGIIVRTLNRLNSKLSIIITLRFSVLINYH